MNIIKCNCCGKEINKDENIKFILPVKVQEVARCWMYGGAKDIILGTHIRPQEQDICHTCQDKIARFCKMLSYVDINMDKIELDIFDKFKEGVSNSIKNNMEDK